MHFFIFVYLHVCIYICIFIRIFIFVYFCIFLLSYLYIFIFSHVFAFYIFCIFYFNFSIICVSYDVLLYMYWMFVCDYVLMYILHVSVLVYCPTYCGGCLMRGRGCLLNGQHLIPWARVYRVDVLWNKL